MKSQTKTVTVRVIILVAMVTVLSIMAVSPVFAYNLWGYEWEDVDPLNYWYNYYDFEDDPDTMGCWYYSAGDWNDTGTEVNYVLISYYPSPDVRCGKAYQSGVPWDGLCSITVQGTTIIYADVTINKYYTDSYSTNKKRSVTCHELGHAVGLGDSSGAVVMNGWTSYRYDTYGIYTPQQDDIDGVNAMY